MKKVNMSLLFPLPVFLTVVLMSFFLSGCARTPQQADVQAGGKHNGLPVSIDIGNLKPGLKAIYFHDKFRHIDEMPKSEKGIAKFGRPGRPILKLDNRFGRGNVFDSGRSTEIGVLMRGYMHLDRPGEYFFQAKSNDGIQVYIDGNLVVNDPGVHGDRLSEPGTFNVTKGGMFPLEIKYFQRKGTATLELYWQPPGAHSYTIVPGAAYSHLEE